MKEVKEKPSLSNIENLFHVIADILSERSGTVVTLVSLEKKVKKESRDEENA